MISVCVLLFFISTVHAITLDPCLSTPCHNGGTCDGNLVTGEFQCFCPAEYGGSLCNTNCTSTNLKLQTDPFNCGTCGTKCSLGLTCCGGSCVSVASNNTRCGNCTHQCSSSQVCRFSNCVTPFRETDPYTCNPFGGHPICTVAQQCLQTVLQWKMLADGDHVKDVLNALNQIQSILDSSLVPPISHFTNGDVIALMQNNVQTVSNQINVITVNIQFYRDYISYVMNSPLESITYDGVEAWGNRLDNIQPAVKFAAYEAGLIVQLQEYFQQHVLYSTIQDAYNSQGVNIDNVLSLLYNQGSFISNTLTNVSSLNVQFWIMVLKCPIGCCVSQCFPPSHPCVPPNAFQAHATYERNLINHCDPDPCENNATCLSSSLSFGCDCSTIHDFTGRYCNVSTIFRPRHGTMAEFYVLIFLSVCFGLMFLIGLSMVVRSL